MDPSTSHARLAEARENPRAKAGTTSYGQRQARISLITFPDTSVSLKSRALKRYVSFV